LAGYVSQIELKIPALHDWCEDMGSQRVTAITPGIIAGACERYGISQESLLLDAGVSIDSISSPSGQIPLEKMHSLWESAMRLTGDDMFALHTSERLPFGAYRLLDYLMAASSTPCDALMRSSRCFGSMNNTFRLSLDWHRDMAYLELHNPSDPKYMPRSYIEYIFTNYLMRLRMVTKVPLKPVEMYVTCEVPKSTAEYDRVLGARVRFRQTVNRMVLPRSLMEIRHPFADPELCELLENHVRQKMKDSVFGEDFLACVYRVLAANMKAGDVTLVSLARQLGKSSRSLQREIQSYGLSFREMLDRVRQERAFFLLRNGQSINEVAWELRFSDASAFCHAFRRWTGQSPQQFKENDEA